MLASLPYTGLRLRTMSASSSSIGPSAALSIGEPDREFIGGCLLFVKLCLDKSSPFRSAGEGCSTEFRATYLFGVDIVTLVVLALEQ